MKGGVFVKKLVQLLFVLVLSIGLLAACGGGETKEPANTNTQGGTASTGGGDAEKLFSANCASCHGADLSGGAGPKLSDVGSRLTKDQILDVIKNGQGFMGANIIEGAEADAVATWLADKK